VRLYLKLVPQQAQSASGARYGSTWRTCFSGAMTSATVLLVLGSPLASQLLCSISKNTGRKSLNGTEGAWLNPESQNRTVPTALSGIAVY
jgi:hypothetical protein